MKKLMLVCGIFLTLSVVFAQESAVVIKVKKGYAVINKGANHGVKTGDSFILHAPNNAKVYGEVEVIKAMNSVAAVKLTKGTNGYLLKVGDVEASSGFDEESFVVDDLLSDVSSSSPERKGYYEPESRRNTGINRKGFIIGGGAGFGVLSMKASTGGFSATDSRGVFQTDFKIGYAPSNTLEIYYVSKVAWWGESNVTLISGLSSVGFSSYLNPRTATGVFLTAGAGLSALDAPFEDNSRASTGFGLYGGAGYEFAKHWSVQADLLYSSISEGSITINSFGVRLMILALAY